MAESAPAAVARLAEAFAAWRGLLAAVSDAAPVGVVAGSYGDATARNH